MGVLTWKQASADYEKKSAGSNTAGTTPSTSGMLSWKQAADEFDRYDEDGYKALGMQRMTQMQERYQAQKDRVSGMERLHADDTVNDWLNRYNRVIQGITRSEQKRNGGFTRDADSVYGAEIDALLSGYDGIKNHSEIRQYYDSLTDLKNSLSAINESFSQFEDESAFDQYMAYWKDQEEKKNLDLDAYSREIAALEQQLEDYDPQIDWTDTNQRKQYDKGLQELEDDINRRKQYLAQAQRIQKKDNLSAVANPESEKYDTAFESKSGYVSTEQDGKLQRMMSQYSMGYDDLTYEYINNQNGIRDSIKQKAGAYKKGETPFEAKGYDYMTEDEVGLYNYYYSMGGKASAEAYLDTIQEDLNQRKAAGMYQQMEGKTGAELVFGVEAGLDQFKGGIKGAVRAVKGDDSYVAPSATQYASGMGREDLADDGFKLPSWLGGASLGQVGYDTITTAANMAPSLAIGMLNPTVGAAAMGVSAGGSAYQEALNEGYSVDQARGYGILSGASEVIMEKVLGGISAYGGNALGKFFTQNMKNADTALKRIAKELGGSMLSEFSEEYLQEVLTPVFQNLTLGTDNEVKLVSAEALYAGFLGAITGGVLEGPSAISRANNVTGAPNNVTSAPTNVTGAPNNVTSAPTNVTGAPNNVTSAPTNVTKAPDNVTKTAVGVSKMENVQVKPDMESFAQQFGTQADAVKRNYMEGQDLQEYEVGFQTAYAMGLEGGKQEALTKVPYLSQSQREIAFSLGRDAAAAQKAAAPKKAAVTAKMTTDEGTQDVTIAEVVDMDDTTMTFRLEDGRTVTDNDLDFENGQELMAAAWELGMDVKSVNTIVTESAVNAAADADQAAGIQQAHHYGQYGYTMEQLTKYGADAAALTDGQRKAAWEAGRQIYLQKAAEPAPALKAPKTSGVWFDAGGGNIRSFDAADLSGLSEAAVAGARAAQVLQKLGIGKNYYFYESYVNKAGERVYRDENGVEKKAPNGWYDPDGSIHIDLNAGANGNGLTLYTLSHELTHFVEKQDKQAYRRLAEFLVASYAKHTSVDELVTRKQAELSESRGVEVSYEDAYSEFIADSMEAMLSDGNVLEKLQELKKTDKSLFDKIREFFDNLARKIREIYKDLTPDSLEGKTVLQMKDQIDQIQQLFAEALVEAGENFDDAMEQVIQTNAEPVPAEEIVTDGAVVTDGGGRRYSIRSMKSDIAEGKMFEDLQTYCNWSKAQVDQLKKDLSELVDYMTPFRDVLDLNETYDREGRRFSAYKPNSDPLYHISMDFSTLCSKRLLTQFVIENLQLRENRPMTAEEQMAIRDMLIEYRKQEKGLQVACAMCYVEAARLKSPKQMQRWMNDPETYMRNYFADKDPDFAAYIKSKQEEFKESRGYKRNIPKKDMKPKDRTALNNIRQKVRAEYKPTASEQAIIDKAKSLPNSTYLTAANLANLSESDPAIYAAYTAFIRNATRSKSLETDEPYYYGDSRRDNGNGIIVNDRFIEAVNRENGMRFSSWSDWRIQHMLDYITAVIDNAVRGAAMHGYTKFPEEVRVLGNTGMMFNLSGVAGTQNGLNPDGSLSFSETESIDINEAIQLRKDFPETAGLQCIGVSDVHIVELLKSDVIDYVIPYHISGLNKALRTMADIQGWKDYTGTQHASIDHSVKLQDAADPEHWHEEPVFSEFFVGYDTGMTGIEAMQESAERYRQMCHDRGLIPKFNQFYEKGNNYWKLLIDRKMINQKTGKLIQQKPVTPAFDFNEIKAVVKRHVDNYDSNMEARALNHIVENWDSVPGRIKDLKKGKKKTAPSLKAVNEVANQMLAAQGKETRRFSDRKKPSDNVAREKAPTFYSYMGTVVAGMKQEKFGAASVVNMLRGKGVKAEEIKWSGIEAWLEGKKSVTKAELQEFIAGSMLQIEEEVREETVRYTEEQRAELDALEAENERLWEEVSDLWEKIFKEMVPISIIGSNNFADRIARKIDARGFGGDEDGKRLRNAAYAIEKNDLVIESLAANAKSENKTAKWSEYTIPGGENYREILFRIPESNFSNHAMQSHWDNTSGVIAHARVQDFGDMLFIEEIQSDWHNEGHKQGYADVGTKKQLNDIRQERRAFQDALRQSKNQLLEDLTAFYKTKRYDTPDKAAASDLSWQGREFFGITQQTTKMPEELANRVKAYYSGLDRIREYNRKISSLEYRIDQGVPDAPFRDNYHEFVLKRMIRDAAEKGYGRLGWTTADIQSQRWSDEYAEGYRIEYDQDIPKFLNKYGKKWGTKVGRTTLGTGKTDSDGNPRFGGGDYSVEVWSMPIPQAMKDSVLYEGQVMYQARATGTSNRDLLAGAFEELARNPDELEFLREYQENVGKLNEQERKLQEIRTEIRELTFGKGLKDPKRLAQLQEEARKTANRIDIYDKKLLRLEATVPLQRVLQRESSKAYKQGKEKSKQIYERRKDRREQAFMRQEIRKIIKRLDALLKSETKEKHVPDSMKKAVAEALSLINDIELGTAERRMDVLSTEVQSLKQKLSQAMGLGDRELVEEFQAQLDEKLIAMQRYEKSGGRLLALRDAYADIRNSTDPDIAAGYDAEVAGALAELSESLKDTSFRDMSKEQLQDVLDMYTMVLTRIRDANKQLGARRGETLQENAAETEADIRKFGISEKDPGIVADKLGKLVRGFSWNNLRPVDAFHRLGSKKLEQLYMDLVDGMAQRGRQIKEIGQFITDIRKKTGYKSFNLKEAETYTTVDGKEMKLTLAEKMSIYAYSKRDQAYDHMAEGGFTYAKDLTYKEKGKTKVHTGKAKTWRLSMEDLQTICGSLTENQRQYVDAVQQFLTEFGTHGDKVNMELYGIKLFNKEHAYFPLQSDRDYRKSVENQLGGTMTAASLKSDGMTKKTVPGANNPIVLEDFDRVVFRHLDKMANYANLVLPLENLRRVFDYQTSASENQAPASMKALIGATFGREAQQYVEQFLTDANGTRMSMGVQNPLEIMFTRSKGMAVAANLSVMIQQISAVVRAVAEISPKHLMWAAENQKGIKLYDEMVKYAPIAIIKDMGGFDTGSNRSLEDYIGFEEAPNSAKKVWNNMQKLFGMGAETMDKVGWCLIWNGVKREVASRQQYEVNSEKFLQECGKRFTEVIVKTQVYDSVLSRSGYMRDKHGTMRYLTSFMGEPTVQAGMVFNSHLDVVRAIQQKKDVRLNVKRLIRTDAALISTLVVNGMLKAIPYAMRDDDEDEGYWERWAKQFGSALSELWKPWELLPILRNIDDLASGRTIEQPDMALLSDLLQVGTKVIHVMQDEEAMADMKPDDWYALAKELAGSVGNLLGVPVKNIWRDAEGYVRIWKDATDGIDSDGMLLDAMWRGLKGEEKTKHEGIYDAMVSGDTGRLDALKATYKTDGSYESAVRKALRLHDSRIKEMANARYEGDYDRLEALSYEIEAEGIFDMATIRAAYEAERTAQAKERGITLEEDSAAEQAEESTVFSIDEYYAAIRSGSKNSIQTAHNALIEEKKQEYYLEREAEDSIASSVTSKVKGEYLDEDISRVDAKSILTKYGGKSKAEAETEIKKWEFQMEYHYAWGSRDRCYRSGTITRSQLVSAVMDIEDASREEAQEYVDFLELEMQNEKVDITASEASSYFEHAKPHGISVEVYLDYKARTKGIQNDKDANGNFIRYSAVKKIMTVIDSLPLTGSQKLALAESNGWADSTIQEYKTW